MANKQECAKNNKFNGNKYCGDPHKNASRFFVALRRIERKLAGVLLNSARR